MVDSVIPGNVYQQIASNAQAMQATASARLGVQEINDQSRLEQQLKALPKDLSAMQQLEAIQGLALQNGRLDAAEKAASMIGVLSSRTEATVLKTEQAAKAREQTQKAEKDDILDLMSSSTDQSSWDLNRTLALSLHPETAKSLFSLLSKPFDPKTVAGISEGRMTPAQRVKAKQEEAAAAEQAERTKLIEAQIKELNFMAPLKAAREAAGTAREWAGVSLDKAREDRERQLAKDEARHGGKNIGRLDAPSTVEIKDAQTHLSALGLNLPTSESAVAASDMAAHAKALQLNSPGKTMTWEEAMQRAMQEFKGQFLTEKSWTGSKNSTYVPRPSDMPPEYHVTSEAPTEAQLKSLQKASGRKDLTASNVRIWRDAQNNAKVEIF